MSKQNTKPESKLKMSIGELAAPFVDMTFSSFPMVRAEIRITSGPTCGEYLKVKLLIFKDGVIYNYQCSVSDFEYEKAISPIDVSKCKAEILRREMEDCLNEREIIYR